MLLGAWVSVHPDSYRESTLVQTRTSFLRLPSYFYFSIILSKDNTYIQGPYFIWQLSFVTSRCYFVAHVGGRISLLRKYDKRADRKWQQTVVKQNNGSVFTCVCISALVIQSKNCDYCVSQKNACVLSYLTLYNPEIVSITYQSTVLTSHKALSVTKHFIVQLMHTNCKSP
jgi:hypothetical protein